MELVASIIKYRERDELTHWLSQFPTRYNEKELKGIYDRTRKGKLILWNLEDVYNDKGEKIVDKGVTIL